ncbi:MAG: hypothetical protein ACP5I8_06765, partial [Phycisphaerae bacterium]
MFTIKQKPLILGDLKKPMTKAAFHIFNFPDFTGPNNYVAEHKTETQQKSRLIKRAVLKAGGWTVSISSLPEGSLPGAKTGYLMTHFGE